MTGKYIAIHLSGSLLDESIQELLIAMLDPEGYEGFVQTDEELKAFIPFEDYNGDRIHEVLKQCNLSEGITFTTEEIEPQNWNDLWEKQFEPVVISNKILIRAPFHNAQPDLQELIIAPKMAFGTGHHGTTKLMMELMLEIDFKGKQVLDLGCGTGILAVLAEQNGASRVYAIDNDPNSYENTLEHIQLNQCDHIEAACGDMSDSDKGPWDIILMNINRNVILANVKEVAQWAKPGATIHMSGFLEQDLTTIDNAAREAGLIPRDIKRSGDWIARRFEKQP